MKVMGKIILSKSFFVLYILIAICGCQTTNTAKTSEPPVSNLQSDKTQPDVEKVEHVENKASTVKKETDQSKEAAELEKAHIEKFQNNFFGILGGHNGALRQDVNKENASEALEHSANDSTVKSAKPNNRPFQEREKRLYGNWINDKKTESYEFHNDGTVLIVVTGQRSKSYTLNGNYILVKEERIKFDFENDALARQMPPRYYKITISTNEIALIDEPKETGGPDGPITTYKRIK